MQDASPSSLGAAIHQARTDRDLTLDGLAGRVGITPGHLAAIERGTRHPTPPLARRITAELAHERFTGDMLTAAIQRRYLGYSEAASYLGISHSHLANLRSGIRAITPEIIDRLIQVAALRPDDLLAPPSDQLPDGGRSEAA